MTYRVLDLFSGIGGFSLGLERTGGFKTVAFCEIDKFCQRVLRKHWPEVPIYDDIRELTAARLTSDGIVPDVLCGGFPCQDISWAGQRAGIEGERSGLWREYARIIGEIRPKFIIVENVAALLVGGLGKVLADLATLGFDAEWHCIPASSLGAPHRRDRVWVLARNSDSFVFGQVGCVCERQAPKHSGSCDMAHPDCPRLAEREGQKPTRAWPIRGAIAFGISQWNAEPNVGRVAHGVPYRVDRLRSLGNAVIPQIPELIGRAILAAEAA